MSIEETTSVAPRTIQIVCTCLNFVLLLIASFNLALCVKEYGNLPRRVSVLNQFAVANLGNNAAVDNKDTATSQLIDVTLAFASFVSVATIIVSLMIAVSVTLEHRNILIATASSSALLVFGSSVSGILCFIVKKWSFVMIGKVLQYAISEYTTMPHGLQTERNLIMYYKHLVDIVQVNGKCCGYNDYSEYFDAFGNNTMYYFCPHPLEYGTNGVQNVPFSCCRGYEASNIDGKKIFYDCVTNLDKNTCHDNADERPAKMKIHTDGCKEKLNELCANLDTITILFSVKSVIFLSLAILIAILAHKYVVSSKGIKSEENNALMKMGFQKDDQVGFNFQNKEVDSSASATQTKTTVKTFKSKILQKKMNNDNKPSEKMGSSKKMPSKQSKGRKKKN